jgi:hypothetical protein
VLTQWRHKGQGKRDIALRIALQKGQAAEKRRSKVIGAPGIAHGLEQRVSLCRSFFADGAGYRPAE